MRAQSLAIAVLTVVSCVAVDAFAHDDLQGLDTVTPEDVTVVHRPDGIVFADANGLTLYVFDEDKPGESTCYRERHCERRWPPLPASADSAAVGGWTVIERQDGSLQWAYRDSPVYTSSEDVTPGVMSGDNARQTWHALFQPFTPPEPVMPPGLAVARVGTDWVFTGDQGRVLYFPTAATADAAADPDATADEGADGGCADDCLHDWTPLAAPMLARAVGSWSVRTRPDGSRQWAYAGKPAYYSRAPVLGSGGAPDPIGWSRLLVLEPRDGGTGEASTGGR